MSVNTRKKILLSGYYGFDNAGDEAVLAALCQILTDRLGNVELVALSRQPAKTAAAYGIRAIDRWDKAALRAELRDAALFCSGGGSLLQDVTSVRSVWYYTSLMRLAQKQGVPTIVLAQGLGPLNTKLGRWLAGRALGGCRLLSWRDAASARLAAEILPPERTNLPSYMVCDPVLLWQPAHIGDEPAEPTEQAATPEKGKIAALALRPWRTLQVAAAARLVRLLRQAAYRPVLLPFHLGEDERLAEQINAELAAQGDEPAEVWHCATPAEARAAVGRADLLLGMRLHSLIMAAAQGVPAAAFSYDPKVEALAKMLQMPLTYCTADWQPEQIAAELQKLPVKPQAYALGTLIGSWQPLLAAINRILDGKSGKN